jgi:hypothetical protein
MFFLQHRTLAFCVVDCFTLFFFADFGKPFLKAGKLTSIRRINNVYTTRYFATKAQD